MMQPFIAGHCFGYILISIDDRKLISKPALSVDVSFCCLNQYPTVRMVPADIFPFHTIDLVLMFDVLCSKFLFRPHV